jgi:hypothetical protein
MPGRDMEFQMTAISSMIVFLAAQAVVVHAPGAAQADANAAPVASPDPGVEEKEVDPVMCERVKEVGSLIRAKKVCMRKSQWEEQRRSDRSVVERSQVQRGLTGD